MYLHICKNIIIRSEDIIGIFDIETMKNTEEYKKIYAKLEEEKVIIDISEGVQKTLILIKKDKKNKAYISNISVATLEKRAN